MHRISRDDLRTLLDGRAVTLVEALPQPHYAAEHLPGSVNLPSELATGLAGQLVPDRTRTVVTYRAGPSCGRSRIAAAAFTRFGYRDVRVYDGGKAGWAGAGLPFEGTHAIAKAA